MASTQRSKGPAKGGLRPTRLSKGRLNRPLPLRRIAQQPAWLRNVLAPTREELRHPTCYVRGVLLWTSVRQHGYTMLGCRRGRTLYRLAREAERGGVTGALLDCGVWNGGSTALLSAGAPSRECYAFDSFEGLPAPDEELDGQALLDREGWALGVEDHVREAMHRYGSPERLQIVKGWFEDTFPREGAAVGPIAVLHADCDWHASVLLTLETFYGRISPGGYIAIDDYGMLSGARQAVDEFRLARGISEPLTVLEGAAYWRKFGSGE